MQIPIGSWLYRDFTNLEIIIVISLLQGRISIVYYPILRQYDIVYWNPYILFIVYNIIWKGYISLTSCWLSLRKFIMKLKVPSLLGNMKMDITHSYCCNGTSNNISTKNISSFQKSSLLILGTGWCQELTRLNYGLIYILTGKVSHLTSVT